MSDMNYVDDDFVRNELTNIHRKGEDIRIDWLSESFDPANQSSARITKSIAYWKNGIDQHFRSLDVDWKRLSSLALVWLANGEPSMSATDDRRKNYEIEIAKTR